jgi:hypothetical protein
VERRRGTGRPMVTHRVAERRFSLDERRFARGLGRGERSGRSPALADRPSRRARHRSIGAESACFRASVGAAGVEPSRRETLPPGLRPTESAARPPSASWFATFARRRAIGGKTNRGQVDGSRTRDTQAPNLMLYPLSYHDPATPHFDPRYGTRTADRETTRKARRRADVTGRLLENRGVGPHEVGPTRETPVGVEPT